MNRIMKQIEKDCNSREFHRGEYWQLERIGRICTQFGPEIKIPGKIFGGTALHTTGGEFSFQLFQPGTETGFLHSHKNTKNFISFLQVMASFR